MNGTVARLAMTPVKGLGLVEPGAVTVGPAGIVGDRAFALVDPDGKMVNGKRIGPLATVFAELDGEPESLRLRFPDGSVVEGDVTLGDPVSAIFFGSPRTTRAVTGPFSDALSAWAGEPLRLVRAETENGAIDRRDRGGSLSLLSSAGLGTLAADMGLGAPLDPRRFRMSVVFDGLPAYAEDEWVGRRVRIGDVVVRPAGGLARCKVPGQDPDTGLATLDVLGTLAVTRRSVVSTEKCPFGVYAEVVETGTIRLGDPIGPIG